MRVLCTYPKIKTIIKKPISKAPKQETEASENELTRRTFENADLVLYYFLKLNK